MKSYTKVYFKYFGYDESSFVPCEACGKQATDIHHQEPRSRNKSRLNDPSNLIALCRPCHHKAETDAKFNYDLKMIHQKKMMKVDDAKIIKYL